MVKQWWGQRLEEEHEAKTVLRKLEKLDVDSVEFTRLLTELRDAVLDHAEHEEKDEFARLGQELSSGARNHGPCREARRSDRAQPPARWSRIAGRQLVAGPFAAMLDRARDAIIGKG
jgi:hypothetical protein